MIIIPIKPLSVNAAWQGRRYKSPAYKVYEISIFSILPRCKETPQGFLEVNYKFYLTNFLKTDCDNLVKCIQDILVKLDYMKDDRYIVKYVIEKFNSKENKIEIEIKQYK